LEIKNNHKGLGPMSKGIVVRLEFVNQLETHGYGRIALGFKKGKGRTALV
jgi:hypothetical protein